jgi:carboxyl-terminal processing protease
MMQMLDALGISHCQLIPQEVYSLLGGEAGSGGRDGWTGITIAIVESTALVRKLEAGSAASHAGVKPGWEILTVGDVVIRDRLEKATEALAKSPWLEAHLHGIVESALEGAVGEPLRLELIDEHGRMHGVELTLAHKPGHKFAAGNLPGHYVQVEVAELRSEVGYVALNHFTAPAHVMPLFDRAIQRFSESKGFVLDLRGNGGGMPGMVIGVARWLLPGEARDLGTAVTRDTTLRFLVPPRPNAYRGRIAVLIDSCTGSGAEVLAGGLKALGRARVFGTPSAGAVLASSIVQLPNGDCFQYAFADFVDPDGVRLEGAGVQPNVEIRQSRDQLITGKDPVIEAAIAWLETS